MDAARVETGRPYPRAEHACIQGPVSNGVYLYWPLFTPDGARYSRTCWIGVEASFWIRLPHCFGVANDGGAESYQKITRHLPVDLYGQAGQALCPYSAGFGA